MSGCDLDVGHLHKLPEFQVRDIFQAPTLTRSSVWLMWCGVAVLPPSAEHQQTQTYCATYWQEQLLTSVHIHIYYSHYWARSLGFIPSNLLCSLKKKKKISLVSGLGPTIVHILVSSINYMEPWRIATFKSDCVLVAVRKCNSNRQ